MYVTAVDFVPTDLKRVSVVLEGELYQALLVLSARSRRSVSNQISVILEQALIASGDLQTPITRNEARGGKRSGAGRKPKESQQHDEA